MLFISHFAYAFILQVQPKWHLLLDTSRPACLSPSPLYFPQHAPQFQGLHLLSITRVHCLSPALDSEIHVSWDFICFITSAVVDVGSGATVHTGWICVYTTAP